MSALVRSIAVGSALAIAATAGYGISRAAVTADAKQAVSPCATVTQPAWSPDGKQIAWYGYRWPLPKLHHRGASYTVLRAFCVADADGTNIQPLRYTVCSEHCSGARAQGPEQLDWVQPSLLLYQSDAGIYTIAPGQKPKLFSDKTGAPQQQFSTDAAGDLLAGGSAACPQCAGPVKILSIPSGAVVGVVGGTKLDNTDPSLSPDGKQVVFARNPAEDVGQKTLGVWTANVDGSNLHRLEKHGDSPLWSPAGDQIAYVASTGEDRTALRLVAPQGGKTTTLLTNSSADVILGWSPDGRFIAFTDPSRRLSVVDVATGKVRKLLQLVQLQPPFASSSVAWSPDSRQLLVVSRPPAHSKCPSGLWRVPVGGGKPHLVHGC